MKFENTKVFNFDGAFRGMRNPKESWAKSDSDFTDPDRPFIGSNDMKLAQQLIRAGSEHRKFMRQIFVCVDITAPDYWFKEFSTYKVGTVENSTSTMHKITSHPITIDRFETDDYSSDISGSIAATVIPMTEQLRKNFLKTKDKRVWKELVRWTPMSWLYTRTVTLNYENLLSICSPGQRRFHKLGEWSSTDPSRQTFINWARSLPYAQELIFIDELFPTCPKQWVLFKDKLPSVGDFILVTDGVQVELAVCGDDGCIHLITHDMDGKSVFTIGEELRNDAFRWWMATGSTNQGQGGNAA